MVSIRRLGCISQSRDGREHGWRYGVIRMYNSEQINKEQLKTM